MLVHFPCFVDFCFLFVCLICHLFVHLLFCSFFFFLCFSCIPDTPGHWGIAKAVPKAESKCSTGNRIPPNFPYQQRLLNTYFQQDCITKNKSGDCPMFASKQGNQPKLPFIKEAASAHTFLMP
jgi:hypothetical protein